jgi:hypothetical protein
MLSQILRDVDLRVTALARPSSTCTSKLQIHTLVREAHLNKKNGKCLKIISMEEKEKLAAGSR